MSHHSFGVQPVIQRQYNGRQLYKREVYRVVEIARSQGLLYWRYIVRVRVAFDNNLYTLAQASELVTDITCSAQALELQELLVAELLRIICLGPLLPDIQQRKVVAACANEVLASLIGVHLLVFRPVEERG